MKDQHNNLKVHFLFFQALYNQGLRFVAFLGGAGAGAGVYDRKSFMAPFASDTTKAQSSLTSWSRIPVLARLSARRALPRPGTTDCTFLREDDESRRKSNEQTRTGG